MLNLIYCPKIGTLTTYKNNPICQVCNCNTPLTKTRQQRIVICYKCKNDTHPDDITILDMKAYCPKCAEEDLLTP